MKSTSYIAQFLQETPHNWISSSRPTTSRPSAVAGMSYLEACLLGNIQKHDAGGSSPESNTIISQAVRSPGSSRKSSDVSVIPLDAEREFKRRRSSATAHAALATDPTATPTAWWQQPEGPGPVGRPCTATATQFIFRPACSAAPMPESFPTPAQQLHAA
eukprot:CAMPEP_0172151178 /NCGR_PEP_ID=MMETSP1050-20130122/74_1 /TAXON_ID=233186 /ORGANISM="Cryptomonas curvata, Strain CCAP979/52" /LENGTH=159 /DNA_ID=CAMNT_0012819233 /DNA_START=197 /DNA_END=673 /DNA_ORIENTATION=-